MTALIRPTLDQFKERAQQGNLIPIYQEILADLETPVSVYRKLADSPFSFLLESVENGDQVGRYSFLGADPYLIYKSQGDRQEILFERDERPISRQGRPLATLREIMGHYRFVPDPDLPPFTGGAVGFMAYDAVRDIERVPDENPDELGTPEYLFMVADQLVAFDHAKRRMILIVNAKCEAPAEAEQAYADALYRLGKLHERVTAPYRPMPRRRPAAGNGTGKSADPVSSFTKQGFEDAVRSAKEYIAAGDIFQVVLSQRLCTRISCNPFDVYRALRAVNPSPYMFYLSCGDLQIAGSSPEILVRCDEQGRANLRPIAGTRPRGATPEEDLALEKDLLADEKEIAEHIMLVDLGRNDLGRVCRFSTVRVDAFQIIERYSHVMHIVSNVVGELQEGRDAFDLLEASFPAGTVSGAPKIRAMEIIDELEPVRRGPYAGAVCYFGFNGAMDSAIVIRTALLLGDKAYVQAGAGIVADSVPENEYQETLNKARGVLRAIEMAEQGLDDGPKAMVMQVVKG
ncbi:MAG: anthranilate synthase component I [Sumerlaeia bacterium]